VFLLLLAKKQSEFVLVTSSTVSLLVADIRLATLPETIKGELKMSFFTISNWKADVWNDEMEAMARDQFAPLIMKVGAECVDFIQTGELTFSVVTRYANESTGISAAQKIAEIRGRAATELPVRMISDVKGSIFVSH
jgi:hypothetical protein